MFRNTVLVFAALAVAVFAVAPAHDKFYHFRNSSHNLSDNENLLTRWFTIQKRDHFDPTDTHTWRQRFFANLQYYKPGGPVFLMIGGEGEESPASVDPTKFNMCHYAKEFNAACLCLEHRYYGESQVFPDSTLAPERMVYLSTAQGLADLAFFKDWFSKDNEFGVEHDAKWIVFGGSYPGSLAAFARIKYPHHFHAASSASAPVRPRFDYIEYMGVVHDVFADQAPDALPVVQEAFVRAEKYITDDRFDDLVTLLKTEMADTVFEDAPDTVGDLDKQTLLSSLTNQIALTVQYAKGDDVKNMREDIMGFYNSIEETDEDRSLKAFARTYNKWYKDASPAEQEGRTITYNYQDVIEGTRIDLSAGRHWTYQCCTEYAYWQTANQGADRKIIGSMLSLEFFQKQCKEVFGIEEETTRAGIKRATIEYGSLKQHGNRIFYFNGGGDPWHALSVNAGNGATEGRASQNAVVVPRASHCLNMYNPDAHPGMDYQELADAREMELKHLRAWLKEDSPAGKMEADEL